MLKDSGVKWCFTDMSRARTRALRVFVRFIVHFDAVACREVIVFQRREPFRENFGINVLQNVRQRACAGKYRPGERRDYDGREAFRYIFRRGVYVGNQIFKFVKASGLIDVYAEYAVFIPVAVFSACSLSWHVLSAP